MAISSLIPPKIATPASVSGGGTSTRMERIVDLYGKLPKGPADVGRNSAFYRFKNSGKPVVLAIGTLLVLGYTNHYLAHLRHHKHREH